MKPVPPAFISMIVNETNLFLIGELYAFTMINGATDYFTGLDIPVTYGGNVYKANSLRIEGLKYKLAVGFQTDEQDIKISAFPGETLAGSSFFSAVEDGLLDGATLVRSRAFWASTSAVPYNDYLKTPVAVVPLFTGLVSQIDKLGRTHLEMKLKSPMKLLDIDMPRNTYGPGCQWTLFDQGCTLNRASFGATGTVIEVYPTGIGVAAGVDPALGADGLPYFAQGQLIFTSGALANTTVSIASNDGVNLYFRYPPIEGFNILDTFLAFPGCSKLPTTCSAKFANLVNFRGFPRVPPVFVSA